MVSADGNAVAPGAVDEVEHVPPVADPEVRASQPSGRAGTRRPWLRDWFKRNWLGVVSCVVVLLAWEIGARVADYLFLPPVSQVIRSLVRIIGNGSALEAISESLVALGTGLAFAIVGGVLVGTLTALSPVARIALSPYIDALMAAPMTAFVPLFILLFGLSSTTRIIVVTLFAFFPIVVNTQAGILAADPDLIMMARSFGASRTQTFFTVRLPASHDYIQAALRMAMARGIEGLIVGEVLIAAVGLGGLVAEYRHAFATDRLFAVVIIIVALAFILQALTRTACRLLLGIRH